MISTKGRYAVRVLADLAEHEGDGLVPLHDVSRRQGISIKYLQHITKLLVVSGVLVGVSGRGGGYRLARPADEINVFEVLEAAEGTMAPVACLVEGVPSCERADHCLTLPLWRRYYALMREFLTSITVADVVNGAICETSLPTPAVGEPCERLSDTAVT